MYFFFPRPWFESVPKMILFPSLSLCWSLFLYSVSGKKAQSQPHILLILADDLGYNDVPWHNPTIIAPHLQELAKAGVILEQNYVQTKCSPSRAALLTGEHSAVSIDPDIPAQGATHSTQGASTRVFHLLCPQG